jgi:dihydrofolate reductase
MSKLRFNITMSLDGFVAGPNQSEENPLGVGGTELHQWLVPLAAFREAHGDEGGEVNASTPVVEGWSKNVGAVLMGRNMFGGGPGDWGDGTWEGWWGDEPPYHVPVFVLTNHPREPLVKSDTTFNFVTEGIESAVEQARQAAGDKRVKVIGGANACNQALAAGLVDEIDVNVSPMFLGAGARLFADLGEALPKLELVRAVDAPRVTHLKYRVG